jgi:hypothetical protein
MKDQELLRVRRDCWYMTWRQALHNMPVRLAYHRRMTDLTNKDDMNKIVPATGQMAALARCLEMRLYSKGGSGFVAHNHIYTAMTRGYGPKDPKRRRALQRLAGPYGKLFARIKLMRLGIADRYHFE